MIKIADLHKNYGSKKVLHDIDITFERGMVYGIVGHNGAGKTTFFKCIAGLEKYEGDIQSDSLPLKNHLGYLDTESYFLPKITGHEYLTLLCEARGKKIIDLSSRNIFDLPLDRYVSTYSSGMKKKLAITAVLLQGNDYFILDEPYNGLDLQSCILLSEIIMRLKAMNKIILLSSHIFATLAESCDEIILLENGTFSKHVNKEDFTSLNEEMKRDVLDRDIDVLFSN